MKVEVGAKKIASAYVEVRRDAGAKYIPRLLTNKGGTFNN